MKESLWLFICDEVHSSVGSDRSYPFLRSGWSIDDGHLPDGIVTEGLPTNVEVIAVAYPDMSDVEIVEADDPPYLVIADVAIHCIAVTMRADLPDRSAAVERTFSSEAIIYALVTVEFGEDWSARTLNVDEPASISLTSTG